MVNSMHNEMTSERKLGGPWAHDLTNESIGTKADRVRLCCILRRSHSTWWESALLTYLSLESQSPTQPRGQDIGPSR